MSGGEVQVVDLVKRFGDVAAVHGINLHMPSGEFFSMLGPSGCGKTTTLRMIAGFEQPTEGKILLDGEDMACTPPHKRNVNTVFQNYALFPHLNVADNVAFGLRRQRVGKQELRQRVAEALELVQLTGFEKRKPAQMSGGQQQRVALARALVLKPAVLLLDEPLGRARRQAAQGAADRAEGAAAAGRDHVHLRHPRPGGGADDERPDRGHVRRPGRAGGAAARGLRGAGDRVRRRLPRRLQPDGRRRASAAPTSCRADRSASFELDALRGKTDARGPSKVTIRPERVRLEAQSDGGANRMPGMVERLVYLGNVGAGDRRASPSATAIQVLIQNTGDEIP